MPTTISGTSGVTFPAGGVGNPAGAVVGTTDTQSFTNKSFDSASVPTVSGTTPLYFSRAWVNFNGTGTVAIRASGNVSSITDNGVGNYTANFTTAMTDTNYSVVAIANGFASFEDNNAIRTATRSVSAVQIGVVSGNATVYQDSACVQVAIFR